MNRTPNEALATACRVMGGKGVLAGLLEVSPQAISQWISGERPFPAERCPKVERLTREKGDPVTCEQLRPDVEWGVLREQAA